MDGFLFINKPKGITSHGVIRRLRKLTGIKRIGHAGTLDPDAEGLLAIGINKGARALNYLDLEPKVYSAVVKFGIVTTTQDASGEVLSEKPAGNLTQADVETALNDFTGVITQIPPMYSAVHHEGKRLYELARKGETVEREPRQVTVHSAELISFESGEYPSANIEIACSSGTYIRTICHDLGEKLGVGGHMYSLVRVSLGRFNFDLSVELDALESKDDVAAKLMDISDEILGDGGLRVNLDESETEKVKHGNSVPFYMQTSRHILIHSDTGELLAIGKCENSLIQPVIVLFP